MQRRLQEQTGSNAECLLAASAHVALSYEMLDRVRACLRRLTLRCCAGPPRTKSQHRSVPARMKDDEVEQSSKQRAQPSTACSSWHTAQLRAVHTQSAINRVIPLEAEHLGDRDCVKAAGLTVLGIRVCIIASQFSSTGCDPMWPHPLADSAPDRLETHHRGPWRSSARFHRKSVAIGSPPAVSGIGAVLGS